MRQRTLENPISQDVLLDALKRTAEALLLTDVEGNITEAGPTVRDVYGYNAAEMIGKNLETFHSRNNPIETINQIRSHVLLDGWQGELIELRKSGDEVQVMMTTFPLKDERGNVVLLANFVREIIGKRKRALQEAYNELHTTYEVSVAISQSIELGRTLKQIVISAQKALNASNCFLFLLEEKRNELVGVATTTHDKDFKDFRIGMRETVAGVWVVKEKQPLSIRDLSKDPRACSALRDRYHQKSALFVPVIVNEASIGTIVLDDTEKERNFSEGEVRIAQSIANQAGLAIQRARLHQAVKEKVQEVTVLYEVGRALTSTLKPENVLDQMMHILRESFGYVHCAILLVDRNTNELFVKAASGYAGEAVDKLRLKVGNEGITGWEYKRPLGGRSQRYRSHCFSFCVGKRPCFLKTS